MLLGYIRFYVQILVWSTSHFLLLGWYLWLRNKLHNIVSSGSSLTMWYYYSLELDSTLRMQLQCQYYMSNLLARVFNVLIIWYIWEDLLRQVKPKSWQWPVLLRWYKKATAQMRLISNWLTELPCCTGK